MMTAMEQEFQSAEDAARHEFESVREEIKNRNSEEYNVLKIQLESTIEELERHFEHAHQVQLSHAPLIPLHSQGGTSGVINSRPLHVSGVPVKHRNADLGLPAAYEERRRKRTHHREANA